MREPKILWEGECCYAERKRDHFVIVIHSTNHVQHVVAGVRPLAQSAECERTVRRLNAYPNNTRSAYGLI